MQGKLAHRRKGISSWKKRAATAYCGVQSQEQDPKTPCSRLLLYKEYEKVEKPGHKPKNVIKLEQAKLSQLAYSSTISSLHGAISPGLYSSGGSGSGVVSSENGNGTIVGSHVFSITTKSGEVHEFRTDTENERLCWVESLQLLIMFPRSVIPEEPKSNPIKDTLRLRLEAQKYGASSVWPVYILPEEVGGRCYIIGTNVLALKSGIQGTLSIYNPADPTSPLLSWDRDKMRRTGKTGNLVFIEIGHMGYGGPGLLWMYSGFNDAQALRETLHNFLFKGDGNAVPLHTQTTTLNEAPQGSFHSTFPPSYQGENCVGHPSYPILSRSHLDSSFVGSPGSFTSPKLEGPPVRLDKHPSIRRKRDASKLQDIRHSSSTNSPMGSSSETSARSGDSVDPIFNQKGSSGQQWRSHSPQDGDVVGSRDTDSELMSTNVRMYDVVSNVQSNSPFQRRLVVGRAHATEYETMVHPSSNWDNMSGGYVVMNRASQASVSPHQSNPIAAPLPSTLQHHPTRQSPHNSAAQNNYDTLPTIREAPKAPEPARESPSIYENHPMPPVWI